MTALFRVAIWSSQSGGNGRITMAMSMAMFMLTGPLVQDSLGIGSLADDMGWQLVR